jgi:hypothetical protein
MVPQRRSEAMSQKTPAWIICYAVIFSFFGLAFMIWVSPHTSLICYRFLRAK